MFAGLKRAATVLLAAGCLLGCEDDRAADKKVRATLAEAREAAIPGTPEADESARQLLTVAVQTSGASHGMLAIAKATLAQAELEQANRLILDIERHEADLRRVAFEIMQLAVQIRSSGSAAVGYRQFDPKPARDQIAVKIAEAQGGPDKPAWFTHGSTTIPTLSAVKQEISRLEGEITQLQQQIQNVIAQRDALIADAEKAADQADQLKGREAVDVFAKSSDLRRQAGEKAIELDKLAAQLARLERDLKISKGEETNLNEVIAQLQAQSAALEAAWKDIDTHIARQQQLATQILGSASPSSEDAASTTGTSIAEKSVNLDRLIKQIDSLRGEVGPVLDSAIEHFADAYTSAAEFERGLIDMILEPKNSNRPELAAWKAAKEAIVPLQYRFQKAGALRVQGNVRMSEASSLANRLALRETVTEAFKLIGLQVPEPIASGDLAAALQNALEGAEKSFKESEELLGDIIDGQSPESLRANARLSRALTLYQWSVVERMANKNDSAEGHITTAKADRDAAAEFGLLIPAMPAELGPPPVRVIAQPEPEPTPETAPQPDPEQVAILAMLISMAQAVQEGNMDAARGFAHIEPGQEQAWEQFVTIATEGQKLDAAIKEKFPDLATTPQGATVAPNLTAMAQGEGLSISGDEASVQTPAGPMKFFIKVDGQWKIYFGPPTNEQEQAFRNALEQLTTRLPAITSDLQSGAIATPEDLTRVLTELTASMTSAFGAPAPEPAPQ